MTPTLTIVNKAAVSRLLSQRSSSSAVFCPSITVIRERAYSANASAPRSTAADTAAAICICCR